MKLLRFCLLSFLLVGLLQGCSEVPQAPAPLPVQKMAASPVVDASAPPAAEQEVKSAFVYDPTSLRDPFVSLIVEKKSAVEDAAPMTPLQTFEIVSLRLIGIITGKGEPRAMVLAPDGKSYILSKGIKIGRNSGVVTEIRADTVLVEEKYYDFSGDVRKNTLEITLPKRGGA